MGFYTLLMGGGLARAQTLCYHPRVLERALPITVALAVALASAGATVASVRDSHHSPTVQGAAPHLALCPTTRNSQQAGRQVDGRSSPPALALPALLPAAAERLGLPGSAWVVFETFSSTRPGSLAHSGRSTRGPPGCDSTPIES